MTDDRASAYRFGQWIRKLRESKITEDGRPMTQIELAKAAGLTTTAVSRIEAGGIAKPAFQDIAKLMYALEQPLEEAAKELGLPYTRHLDLVMLDSTSAKMISIFRKMPQNDKQFWTRILQASRQFPLSHHWPRQPSEAEKGDTGETNES